MSGYSNAVVVRAVGQVRQEQGACSFRALAAELGCSTTNTVALVERLEGDGLLERSGSAGGIEIVGTTTLIGALTDAMVAALEQAQ